MNPLSSSVSSLYGRRACSGRRTEGGPPTGVDTDSCLRCTAEEVCELGMASGMSDCFERWRRRRLRDPQQPASAKAPKSPLSAVCLLLSKPVCVTMRTRASKILHASIMTKLR